ncbi:type VI secretion system baseplate subunit TssF [Colwellia sp. KU-HH00111]|uniref:type VI secretion system baseplate subunit TssF n=1 Tax=Colwellia sp. KU-HH00111 TaxID=3127652 RepID=UPI003109E415
MDKNFLEFYNQELKFIREMGAEFSNEYPKIAGRLGLDGFDCSDPYVERLLEGFAFLSARIHQKLDASYPKFTQHLIELLFPTFQHPSPSMLIAQFEPDLEEGSLAAGVPIKRGTALHSLLGKGEQTACEYRTSQEVTLFPIYIDKVEYLNSQEIVSYVAKNKLNFTPKAGVLINLKAAEGHLFNELNLNSLDFHIRGSESFPLYLFETIYKGFKGCLYKTGKNFWRSEEEETSVHANGYDKDESLLPYTSRQFDGFRLLKEYFLFVERFQFLSIKNLKPTINCCNTDDFQLILLLDQHDQRLEKSVSKDNFALFCTPAINLFPKKADRINLSKEKNDFHVVPDKLRPLDFEVCSIEKIEGFSSGIEPTTQFAPLYGDTELSGKNLKKAFFTVNRETRRLNVNQRKFGHRSSYIGSELFISLVDPKNAPYSDNLRQLSVNTYCSNRDLPLMMPLGKGKTDFTIETGAPCNSVRCLGEPTRPQTPPTKGSTSWDLINQLSINFLGMCENNKKEALSNLKTLLTLMMDKNDFSQNKQIDGIINVDIERITRRLPFDGPLCFGRGVAIKLLVDELAYEGSSVFMLGMVLDKFFAQYVSVNSFTQMVLISSERGEIFRWPIRIGLRNPI